jgi:hypothetical protein
MNAYQKGQIAQQDGVFQEKNPYYLGSHLWWKWREGWENEKKWAEGTPSPTTVEGPVDFSIYQQYVEATIPIGLDKKRLHWNAIVALSDVASQMSREITNKIVPDGKVDKEQILDVVGEALWHLAAICVATNSSLEVAVRQGMAKRAGLVEPT